jgi:hypothetical protein
MEYNYLEGGYYYLALHRKLVEFDPRLTENILILDYFGNKEDAERKKSGLYHLANIDIKLQNSNIQSEYPISFSMVIHDISIAWSDLIKNMLFKEDMVDTFCSEYIDVIAKIVSSDSPNKKESVVYRFKNGETIFHLAAKIHLLDIADKNTGSIKLSEMINKELNNILIAYTKLGRSLNRKNDAILSIKDYTGKSLKQYMTDFSLELTNYYNPQEPQE